MHYYLSILFSTYSLILLFESQITPIEKETIILKISEYLNFFEKRGTSFGMSLVKIFIKNEENIFGQFCTQILGFYCQRGYDLYSLNEKKYAKHYLEEALLINQKYSVQEKVKNNSEHSKNLNSILDNCKYLINIIKAQSIQKYCKSFSRNRLINENEFTNEEEKLDILDRFKEALILLNEPKTKEDKLLKAIYLGNIIKIEYKIFNSNNYDTLLKMIESCLNLKAECPEEYEKPNLNQIKTKCLSKSLDWTDEICKYKMEINEKIKNGDDNKKVKEDSKNIIEAINDKFKEGKIAFLFYILTKHEPNGLDDDWKFDNEEQLNSFYKKNEKKFMKKLRILYNPYRYNGDKEQQIHYIMQEISKKLNSFNSK